MKNGGLVKIELLDGGGYDGFNTTHNFPVEVLAPRDCLGYSVTILELMKVGYDPTLDGAEDDGEYELYFHATEVNVIKNQTPTPRFRKKRIDPPVRVKSDVRITYTGDVGYTITNVKQIIISKDSDAAFITSIVKGIKTQVELPLSEIDSIKLKTPKSVYDFHVEGAYPDILIVNPKLGMTASAKYFSLNLED